MVKQYETSQSLQRNRARTVLAHTLRTRSTPGAHDIFYHTRVLPAESYSPSSSSASHAPHVSPRLVSTVRRLRWALQRDRLAHFVKDRSEMVKDGNGGLMKWLEGNGRVVMWRENERLRLALCPGIKGIVRFYEGLAR